MALSLYIIGALKSRVERDAKAMMQDLLARRKDGREISQSIINDFQVKSLIEFTTDENVSLPGDVVAVAQFYKAALERELEGLRDVLNAAAGTGARG